MFARHHYLSHSHNNAATVYVATVNGKLAAFLSVLHFPHPVVKDMKKVHRLVVLPDYQGCGVGGRMLDLIGANAAAAGFRLSIVTSSPALSFGLRQNPRWLCSRAGRTAEAGNSAKAGGPNGKQYNSKGRVTTSWEYVNN